MTPSICTDWRVPFTMRWSSRKAPLFTSAAPRPRAIIGPIESESMKTARAGMWPATTPRASVSRAARRTPDATATSSESSVMLAPVSSQNSWGCPLILTVTTGVPKELRRRGSVTGMSGTSTFGTGTSESAFPHRSTPASATLGSEMSPLSGSAPIAASAGQSDCHDNAIVSPIRARARTMWSVAFTCNAWNATAASSGLLAINVLSATAKVRSSNDFAARSADARSSIAMSAQKSRSWAFCERNVQCALSMRTVALSSMVSVATGVARRPSTIASAAGSGTPPP